MTQTAADTDSRPNDNAGVITLDNLSVSFGGRPILKSLNGELRGRAHLSVAPEAAVFAGERDTSKLSQHQRLPCVGLSANEQRSPTRPFSRR